MTDMQSTLQSKVTDKIEEVDYYKDVFRKSLLNRISNNETRLEGERKRINALNPTGVLSRGYSIVKNKDGHVLSSIKDVKENELIYTTLSDGIITSTVKEVK